MVYLLAAYALGASALLIWMTARDRARRDGENLQTLAYEAISPDLLWICCTNLIVIDLRPRNVAETTPGFLDALTVPREELSRILLWFPPESKLVFYEESGLERFDSFTESILSGLGIHTIYFLRGGLISRKRRYAPGTAQRYADVKDTHPLEEVTGGNTYAKGSIVSHCNGLIRIVGAELATDGNHSRRSAQLGAEQPEDKTRSGNKCQSYAECTGYGHPRGRESHWTGPNIDASCQWATCRDTIPIRFNTRLPTVLRRLLKFKGLGFPP